MAAYRKPIDFDPGKARDNLLGGGCSILASLISIAIAISFFSAKTSIFDWIAYFWLIPPMVLFSLFGVYFSFSEGLEGLKKNKKWRHETTVMETNIVDCQEIYYEDDGYTAAYSVYHLSLGIVPDQQAVSPGETLVIACVSQSIFKKYAHKQSARISYLRVDPLVFLIEGEM